MRQIAHKLCFSACAVFILQAEDQAWYLPYSGSDMVVTSGIATFAECAALCKQDCQLFTYDYKTQTCHIKQFVAPTLMG